MNLNLDLVLFYFSPIQKAVEHTSILLSNCNNRIRFCQQFSSRPSAKLRNCSFLFGLGSPWRIPIWWKSLKRLLIMPSVRVFNCHNGIRPGTQVKYLLQDVLLRMIKKFMEFYSLNCMDQGWCVPRPFWVKCLQSCRGLLCHVAFYS